MRLHGVTLVMEKYEDICVNESQSLCFLQNLSVDLSLADGCLLVL
jgi:hypothetical protein